MTTYPTDYPGPEWRHDGRCSFCTAAGVPNPPHATRGALRGQGWAVGPAACDDHADWLDARQSANQAWMVVDGVARAAADATAHGWPLGLLVVIELAGPYAGRVGMVTAHGPAEVRVLLPTTGEAVFSIDHVRPMVDADAA